MVLLSRIELPTSPLPRECSTTELQQHAVGASLDVILPIRKCNLDGFLSLLYGINMTGKKKEKNNQHSAQTREDRLKAALKANMAKRKAQAKARSKPTEAEKE